MKFSIVTPSFNQIHFLEKTICSVLNQQGVEIEYIVIDGGSTDGSAELIARYASKLAYWCSEKDNGPYAAINKGFEQATGDVLAWLNCSDIYLPWALPTVQEIFCHFPEVDWIASLHNLTINERNQLDRSNKISGFSRNAFLKGLYGSRESFSSIQQSTCFWRRSLWEKIGGKIPDTYSYAADFHLWSLFFEQVPLVGIECPLAAACLDHNQLNPAEKYDEEVEQVLTQLRAQKTLPSHQHAMPILSRNLSQASSDVQTVVKAAWVLDWQQLIFDNSETVLHKKEATIAELSGLLKQKEKVSQAVFQQKEAVIKNLTRDVNKKTEVIQSLRAQADLKYQMKITLRDYWNKVRLKNGRN